MLRTLLRGSLGLMLCAAALAGGGLVARATNAAPVRQAVDPIALAATATPTSALRRPEPQPAPSPPPLPLVDSAILPELSPEPPLAPFGEPLRDGAVMMGGTANRLILFTFDDGPDVRYTARLLDTLDRLDIRAVFFLTAARLVGPTPRQEAHRELAREIVRRGHIVGNHTIDHAQLPLVEDHEVERQVRGADEIFTAVLGDRTWLLRPPGGARSPRVDALIARWGYTQVLWNLGSGDFQVREPEEVVRVWRRVLERREAENGERGGIVLLHDTHEWSVDAVPMMVDWIRSRNCDLLAEGEELYEIVGDPSFFFRPRGESPSEMAPLARLSDEELATRQRQVRAETEGRCQRLASR